MPCLSSPDLPRGFSHNYRQTHASKVSSQLTKRQNVIFFNLPCSPWACFLVPASALPQSDTVHETSQLAELRRESSWE